MQRLTAVSIGIVLTLWTLPVFADSAVRVNALNYPAWLVRSYQTMPLQPGTRLQKDDLIRTGEGGRVQLRLADGSVVRLGESSRFVIRQAVVKPASEDNPIALSFQALRGVFRVSSGFFDAIAPARQLKLNIGAIHATVGSADIWGRSDLAQDAVCLIEGDLGIEVQSAPRIDMNQALSCFVKPRDQAPLPVDLIDMQQHRLWIAETDLREDSGIVAEDGQWQLVLISLADSKSAERLLESFHERGFAAQDKTVVRQGRTLHRLLLPGFVSVDAALKAREGIEQQLGLSETWVWKAN